MRNDLINILSESYPQYTFEEIFDGEAIAVGKKSENDNASQAKAIFYDYMSLDDIKTALNDENFLENPEVNNAMASVIGKSYEEIKANLSLMLVPATKKYEEALHKSFKNLLIVPVIDYPDKDYTVLVKQSMYPDITEEQIFEDAQLNLNKKELEIISIVEYLNLHGVDVPTEADIDTYFIRWKGCRTLGASTFLHPDFCKKVKEVTGWEEVLILPSSKHELIAVKYEDEAKVEACKGMVHEINRTEVSPKDFLSDSVYHITATDAIIEL